MEPEKKKKQNFYWDHVHLPRNLKSKMLLVPADLFSPVLFLLLLISHFNTWKGHCLTAVGHTRIDNDYRNFAFMELCYRLLALWCRQESTSEMCNKWSPEKYQNIDLALLIYLPLNAVLPKTSALELQFLLRNDLLIISFYQSLPSFLNRYNNFR